MRQRKNRCNFWCERLTIPTVSVAKTLEEPPTYAQIILTANNVYVRCSHTIQSRCMVIKADLSFDLRDNEIYPQPSHQHIENFCSI